MTHSTIAVVEGHLGSCLSGRDPVLSGTDLQDPGSYRGGEDSYSVRHSELEPLVQSTSVHTAPVEEEQLTGSWVLQNQTSQASIDWLASAQVLHVRAFSYPPPSQPAACAQRLLILNREGLKEAHTATLLLIHHCPVRSSPRAPARPAASQLWNLQRAPPSSIVIIATRFIFSHSGTARPQHPFGARILLRRSLNVDFNSAYLD